MFSVIFFLIIQWQLREKYATVKTATTCHEKWIKSLKNSDITKMNTCKIENDTGSLTNIFIVELLFLRGFQLRF